MNGAESLVRTLLCCGIDVCFSNPGTSEMHFVAALDKVAGIRCILGLFEGVATGAADGYARMTDTPAATLLHLGPGLGNGLANLHNARKANAPIVNIVGEHAITHLEYDAPLTADIEGIARTVSAWVRTCAHATDIAKDAASAIVAARNPPGQVATLILPANAAWEIATEVGEPIPVAARTQVNQEAIEACARTIRKGMPVVLVLGNVGLRQAAMQVAGKLATLDNVTLLAETFSARAEQGAGCVIADRVPYVVDNALGRLADTHSVILAGAKAPIAFFRYPDKPSELYPSNCQVLTLATVDEDITHALDWLTDELGLSGVSPLRQDRNLLSIPRGTSLTPQQYSAVIAALLPEGAIVIDEAISAIGTIAPLLRGAAPHDLLQTTGGAIGIGPPLATGAAIACPHRSVVNLQADGSAMYTLQALWTQAREGLNVTTIIFANRSYAILKEELANVGATTPGAIALNMLDIGNPDLDWVDLAHGMGVEAVSVTTTDQFVVALTRGLEVQGPYLIELVL